NGSIADLYPARPVLRQCDMQSPFFFRRGEYLLHHPLGQRRIHLIFQEGHGTAAVAVPYLAAEQHDRPGAGMMSPRQHAGHIDRLRPQCAARDAPGPNCSFAPGDTPSLRDALTLRYSFAVLSASTPRDTLTPRCSVE